MKKTLLIIAIAILVFLAFILGVAIDSAGDNTRMGVVDVNQVFKDSTYVKNANQKLQADAKNWQDQVNAEQQKLKGMVSDYQAKKASMSASDKKEAEDQIAAEQTKFIQLVQTAQQSIRQEQATGMQKFSDMVRAAAQKVASSKRLNIVFTDAVTVYADKGLDVTKAVEAAMPNS